MAALYDYYRPHSSTLMGGDDDITTDNRQKGIYPERGETSVEREAQLVPVQPCIVLDARSRNDDSITRLSLWESDIRRRRDDVIIPAVDVTRFGGDVLRSMWTEIVDLRGQLRKVQSVNRQLRKEMDNQTSPRKQDKVNLLSKRNSSLYHPDEGDFEKFEAINKQLSEQTIKLFEYKEKVNHLQAELKKKQKEETELFPKILHHSFSSAQSSKSENDLQLKVRDRDKKIRGLELALGKQEEVIEQLEKLLERKENDDREKRTNDMLIQENRRLKLETEKIEREFQEKERQREAAKERIEEERRKTRMENRIKILEKQIADNAKKWMHERSDLTMRLREAELGLWPDPIKAHSEYLPSEDLSSSKHTSNKFSQQQKRPKQKSAFPELN